MLIIFDCDGTLVDTEYLYCVSCSNLVKSVGIDYCTPEYAMNNFKGGMMSSTIKMLSKKHNVKFPENFLDIFIENALLLQEEHQKIIPNVEEVIRNIRENTDIAICVASNGERKNVINSLKTANLDEFFDENVVFTSADVSNPKPDPDIFLYVIENMGFSAEETVIIEDSITGIKAAKAANIDVIAFTGAIHDENDKKRAIIEMEKISPMEIIDDFIHILDSLKISKNLAKQIA